MKTMEMHELTDSDLAATVGGSFIGDIADALSDYLSDWFPDCLPNWPDSDPDCRRFYSNCAGY